MFNLKLGVPRYLILRYNVFIVKPNIEFLMLTFLHYTLTACLLMNEIRKI